MSGRTTGNVFDRFGNHFGKEDDNASSGDAAESSETGATSSGVERYQAVFVDKSKAQTRLRLQHRDGVTVQLLNYAYLLEVLITSHQLVTLIFTNAVVTLKGRHLDALIEPMQDDRVRALVCFHPDRHDAPDDSNACIMQMDYVGAHEAARG